MMMKMDWDKFVVILVFLAVAFWVVFGVVSMIMSDYLALRIIGGAIMVMFGLFTLAVLSGCLDFE